MLVESDALRRLIGPLPMLLALCYFNLIRGTTAAEGAPSAKR